MMKNQMKTAIKFAFLGTTPLAEGVLGELARVGLIPEKVISEAKDIPKLLEKLSKETWDVFVVASFGAILPKALLEMPKHGTLNVHPSLLPRLRGPSPVRSAILNDEKETGVSIILLDEEMDHGLLLAQKKISVQPWPPHGKELDSLLAREGGKLLAQVMPLWVTGDLEAQEQNHDLATYTKRFVKEDGLLDLSGDAYQNLLKVRAFDGWPGTYTFFERAGKKVRVQILDAHLDGSKFIIDSVKPEGKREMPYVEFLKSGAKPL